MFIVLCLEEKPLRKFVKCILVKIFLLPMPLLCIFFSQLRTAMEKSTAMFDREKAQERLSKLSGGVAVLKVCLFIIICS